MAPAERVLPLLTAPGATFVQRGFVDENREKFELQVTPLKKGILRLARAL